MRSKILGVAGGNGVVLHPFKENLVGNIEPRAIFGTPNEMQWKLNFPKVPFDRMTNVRYSNVDVIIGAPDCGHSSVFAYSRAKKLGDATENDSLNLFITEVQRYKPKVFMMENLPKMLDSFKGKLYEAFSGYRSITFIEPVSAWGNSQVTRIRLVIVGIREDLPNEVDDLIKLPDSTTFKLKFEKELLQGLTEEQNPSLCHVREPDNFMVCMIYNGVKKISVGEARRLWRTEYRELKKWPANYGSMVNQPGVYRNFANEHPLTVRKQNRQFNHNGYMLSPREMARIQGIPDKFKLWYDPNHSLYCINKARATCTKTPPYEIGVWFYSVLNKIEKYF